MNKFKELVSDPIMIRGGKLQRLLRDLKRNSKIDKEIYNNIYPTGSQLARIYGLPKMHEIQSPTAKPPYRPIFYSLNTLNCQFAKYLCRLSQPLLPNAHLLFLILFLFSKNSKLLIFPKKYGFFRRGKFIY